MDASFSDLLLSTDCSLISMMKNDKNGQLRMSIDRLIHMTTVEMARAIRNNIDQR
jgi:hypothetical protein